LGRFKLVGNWLKWSMRSVGAFEAKTHLAALLDAVSAGEQITITRHGRPVARLVPPAAEPPSSVVQTIERLRHFSKGQSLDGLSLAELRDQGRR
jgi:prevent-host-death family protein